MEPSINNALIPLPIDVNAMGKPNGTLILTASQATGFKVQGARLDESINDHPDPIRWKDSLWIEEKYKFWLISKSFF